MKIVCEHCGAKYSIADEKVAGKIFKIRCKKCDETLEVRGDQVEAAEGDELTTNVYDYSSEAVWYVVIDGEQQGPLTALQLGSLVAKGDASLDSYVWKEGFDDWKVANDVPELVEILGGSPKNESEEETGSGIDPDDAPTALSEVAAGSGLNEASLFGGASEPAPQAQPQAASGGNMFAAFEGNGGGVTSASAPMTGQRNENSVLFSLSNLQQLATSHHPGAPEPSVTPPAESQPAAAAVPPGHASGEGSGLIDIRQLAMATSPGTTSASSAPPRELLAIGGTSPSMSGGLAPVALPHVEEAERRSRLLWIAGAAVLLLIIGTFGYLAFREEPQVVQVGPGGDIQAPTAAVPAAVATPEPPEPAAAEPPPAAAEPEPEPEPAPPAPTIAEPAPKKATSRSKRTSTRPSRPKPAPKTASSTSAKKKSLDQLMDDVLGDKSSSSKSSSSKSSKGSSLPATPSRTDVAKALNGVRGGVRSCRKDKGGVATVSVTFAGSTGRVSSAKITGPPFRGTSVGSCIERTVKRARVSRFSRRTFNVKFPYRL